MDSGGQMVQFLHRRRTLTVGILEDNQDYSTYLEQVLAGEPGVELLFNVALVAEAQRRLQQGPAPDLMLVDMQLPDGSGLDIVKTARSLPDTRILVLTVLADTTSVVGALQHGAHGYLLKDAPAGQIRSAIGSVMDGGSPISSEAAARLVEAIRRPGAGEGAAAPTPREAEIARLMAKGLSYAEMAAVTGLSIHTVGDHVKAIYRKLSVNSRAEAIYEARTNGWISLIE
ncbi:MAG: response regulator transcription factor [Sphingopyxis sp.]|nr:response regulator transcription factor [Sphingopyxis sp.]